MRTLTRCFLLLGCLAASAAQAVMRGPGNRGQVLIFPYYTVNAGNQTLVSLVNNSDVARVVQLRVAEGDIGETAFVANLYLSPRDAWAGALFQDGIGDTYLISIDTSCMVPPLEVDTVDPRPTRRLVITGSGNGNGKARLREGWLEAVEVASILPGTATSSALGTITAPRNCAAIHAAWTAPGGYWLADSRRDLANPIGGLSGYSAVINVPKGIYFGMAAVALEEFRVDPADAPRGSRASVVSHAVPQASAHLGLDAAVTDPALRWVRADVVIGTRPLSVTYPIERAIDAVSAVLAASEISADFDTQAALGATTSFVQLFPTKRFYTNPALLPPATTAPLPPFSEMYNASAPLSVIQRQWLRIFDREGKLLVDSGGLQFGGCEASSRHPATALAVTSPGGRGPDPLLGTRLHGPMTQICGGSEGDPFSAVGTVTLSLARQTFGPEPIALRPSREGVRMAGLPIVATRLINYVNEAAQPGLLANYAAALPVSATAQCSGAAACGE